MKGGVVGANRPNPKSNPHNGAKSGLFGTHESELIGHSVLITYAFAITSLLTISTTAGFTLSCFKTLVWWILAVSCSIHRMFG